MRKILDLLIFGIMIAALVLVIYQVADSGKAIKPLGILRLPELVSCGVNNSFRCISNQDWMQIVAAFSQHHEGIAPLPGCKGGNEP